MWSHEGVQRPIFRLAGSLILVAVLAGCQRDEVRVYDTPKEERSEPVATTAPDGPIRWTLPDGWREVPGTGMRHATLVVDDGDAPLEVRVTPLGKMARDPLANVNRWRQQLGLSPVTEGELGHYVRTIDADGVPVELVDLESEPAAGEPPTRILAAIAEGSARVWFFMMMDDADRIAPHAEAFEALVRSLRFGSPAAAETAAAPSGAAEPSGAGAASGGAATGGVDDASWTAPDGWQPQSSTSAMRLAGYDVVHDGLAAEVTVTRFPGDVGGLLANVNRWRNQLGLAPVATLEEQPTEPIAVGGESGTFVELTGPADPSGERQRALVAMATHGGMTWFFKMSGPVPVIEHEAEAFMTFVNSVRFAGTGMAGNRGG
jgi:hypothetical protein